MKTLDRTRPSEAETLLRVAEAIAERSTCNRLAVGAVLATNGRIVSTGYNGAPPGVPHCDHRTAAPCDRAIHAEANAILAAARHGIPAEGAVLYSTHSPCLRCARFMIMSGVESVVYRHPYRDVAGVDFLRESGIACAQYRQEMAS